jgi:antitoxin ParD1/3/4
VTITLSDELERLINERVGSGAYKSADEVVEAGLRLLKAREEGAEALRREIGRGLLDIREGRFSAHTTDDELEDFSERVVGQARGGSSASERR